jgi:polysaccharide export outer membrane protein
LLDARLRTIDSRSNVMMSLSQTMGPFVFVAALVLTMGSSQAATLSNVEWQEDPEGGSASLVLAFDSAAPDFELRSDSRAVYLRIPGSASTTAVPDPVDIEQDEQGIRLTVQHQNPKVQSITVDGSSLVVSLLIGSDGDGLLGGYRLGVGDMLTVSVYRDEELSGDYPVSQDGMVRMPLVGAVKAAGLSESELTEKIRAILADFLVDPQVSVAVRDYQSQFVVVTGAVPSASRVTLRPGMSLKAVLSEAGIALPAGQKVHLTRAGGFGETIVLPALALDAPDAPLPRDGDVLTVQEPDYVFVGGEVRSPGRIEFTPGLTLQQVLAMAGGLTEWGARRDVRIQRGKNDETADVIVDLKKVEQRKVSDPTLMPGDLILVRRRLL